MTKNIILKAFVRESKEKPAEIRQAGFIPAILYGKGIKNQGLKVKYLDFEKTMNKAGESSLFDLVIDDKKPIKIIIKDLQKEAVNDKLIHVDLCQVDMKKKIIVEVPITLKGESQAVKELGGTLVTNKDYLRVQCLPSDLLSEVVIPIDNLKEFSDIVRVEDVELPEGVTLAEEVGGVLISISAPRIEKTAKEEEEEEAGEEAEAGKAGEEAEAGKKETPEEDKKEKKSEA